MVKGQKQTQCLSLLSVEITWLREEKRKQVEFVEYLLGPAYGGRDSGTPLTGNSGLTKRRGFNLHRKSLIVNLDKNVLKNENSDKGHAVLENKATRTLLD